MRTLYLYTIAMMGIGFTLGFLLSLLIQLPVITLPTYGEELVVKKSDDLALGYKDASDLKSNVQVLDMKAKHDDLNKSLRGLKNTRHGVVYSTNNGSNSYLEEKTQHILIPASNYGTVRDAQSAISDQVNPGAEVGLNSNEKGWTSILKNIVNGVYWTPKTLNKCSSGFQGDHHRKWVDFSPAATVIKMAEGCGRMQNRMLTFLDGSHACARYRLNTDQIQGEIYSFYLGKLLQLPNLPPTSLKFLNSKSPEWNYVHADMANAQWADSKVVVMTQWIDNLNAAYIPKQFRNDDRNLHPTSESIGSEASEQMLCDLVQWSDLIVFDYLTANLDRVVNNMFNKQWNNQMMENPAHNLEKQQDGHLVFLDNESGLFHGYRLLDKYSSYHSVLLDSLCVFRNRTAQIIEDLHQSGDAGEKLHVLFTQHEPLAKHIPKIPKKNSNILQQRIADVYNQIVKCKEKFSN